MNASPQGSRESRIPRHHQDQPARTAGSHEVSAQTDAVGVIVMPKDHPGEASRQAGDGCSRIR